MKTILVNTADWAAEAARRPAAGVPGGWVIANAPRPLAGQLTWTGPFRHGIFYAASEQVPAGTFGWEADDAWLIEFITNEQIRERVTAHVTGSGCFPSLAAMEGDGITVAEVAGGMGLPWHDRRELTYATLYIYREREAEAMTTRPLPDPVHHGDIFARIEASTSAETGIQPDLYYTCRHCQDQHPEFAGPVTHLCGCGTGRAHLACPEEGGKMETYATMTVTGGRGSSFRAQSWEEATAKAEAAGYEVIDEADLGGENILVIAE